MSLGIVISPRLGIGDALQFSSVPENYYRHTGRKLVDVNRPWFFDDNPFVIRSEQAPVRSIDPWNFSPHKYVWPRPRKGSQPQVYLSNAEIWAALFEVPVALNRPRLYRHEEVAYEDRELILLHVDGRSHGVMPGHVIDHVLRKYGPSGRLRQVGPGGPDLGIGRLATPTLWDLARVISTARMFIGMDSGPSWVAACYPDVITKKVRSKPGLEQLREWAPLAIENFHAHWDDRCQQIYNVSEEDVGFTWSYRKI